MKVAGINQGSVLFLDKEVKQKSMPVGQEACRTGAKVQPREQRDGHNEIAFPPQVLHEAVDKANHILEVYGTELHFSLHEASGEMIVRVINTKDELNFRRTKDEAAPLKMPAD